MNLSKLIVRQVQWLAALTLLAAACLLSGCQSTKPNPLANVPRFHEAEQVSAVFKYDSWDYIFMLQPAQMEGDYRRILKAEDVPQVVRTYAGPRHLAVVLVGWQYSAVDQQKIGQRWHEMLKAEGFQRVVCLKTAREDKLNGSPITFDSANTPLRLAAY